MAHLSAPATYRIEGLLGRGAATEVRYGVDQSSGEPVALKVLVDPREGGLGRLFEEAARLREVRHPNVRKLVDSGFTEAGVAYLALTYVPGCTLADRLRGGRRLHGDEAAALFEQLAAGLAAVHRAGIVHRDIKPANVLLLRGSCDFGHVILSDFGVATRIDEVTNRYLVGTAGFIAPEVVNGKHGGDPAADVYALGVLMHRAVTGVMPDVPQDVVPIGLPGVIARCLDSDPSQRPTAQDLLTDLGRLLAEGHPPVDGLTIRASPALVGLLLGSLALLVGGVALVSVLAGTAMMRLLLMQLQLA